MIGIETKPALLKFTQEPPETVGINEVFEIRIQPQIKGGSPLQYAVVKCNITEYFTQETVSSHYFSNIAQN